MKRIVKACYVLIVGLIVFTGALLIAEGLQVAGQGEPISAKTVMPDDTGSAL